MNFRKFKTVESDFDKTVSKRVFSGRLTKKRYKIIAHAVRRFNNEHRAPYGRSPNGYAYRCGCEYDCCGCLVSSRLEFSYKAHQVIILYYQSFNY